MSAADSGLWNVRGTRGLDVPFSLAPRNRHPPKEAQPGAPCSAMSILEGQYLARRISIGTALLAPTSRSRSTGAPEGPGRARLRREFVHWRTDRAACGCLNTLRVITPRRARAIRRSPKCTLAAVYFCCLSFCFLFCDEPWPANGLNPSIST